MISNYEELDNEIRMLDGNIARICVTNDNEEMKIMYAFAELRLEEILNYNLSRINKLKNK